MTFGMQIYPPGYRFLPTDAELVTYYLARQTAGLSSPSSPILEVQIYNYSPDENFKTHNLSEDDEWYFFSSRMKRYINSKIPDRTAGDGFWKASGAKTIIYNKNEEIGSRTSLVYHPNQLVSPSKSNWLMTEYQITQNGPQPKSVASESMLLDKWVLCKIYRAKRSPSEKSLKNQNAPVVKKDQQELAYEEPASLPPAPVSQMMLSSQESCSVLNEEQQDSWPSPDEQINSNLDLDHMSVDEVKRYFQESQSAYNEPLTSQTDPQSSYGGHVNQNPDVSDMRELKPNDMNFKPSTSDNPKTINNLQQDVVMAPKARHHQQFLQEPQLLAPPSIGASCSYFDSTLCYDEATTREILTEPLMNNNPVYDFSFFDPEPDFFANCMASVQSNKDFGPWSSLN